MGWFATYSFTSDGGKIRSKDGVSIKNVIVCDWAVLQHVETYQGLEIALRWAGDHPHEAASTLSVLDLLFGETLKILTSGVHINKVVVDGSILVVRMGSIDKEDSCLRVGIEVHIKWRPLVVGRNSTTPQGVVTINTPPRGCRR